MADSLNQFLAQAGREGKVESGGVFTLATDEARAKIRRFQLTDPYLYVVHLLSSAVCGGAGKFRAYSSSRSVEFQFDGQRPTFDELHNLFDYLFGEKSEVRRLQELAIALNGALATQPKSVLFQCYEKGDGIEMELEGEEVVVRKLERPWKANARGNRLYLEYSRGFSLSSLFGQDRPERGVLRRFCWCAPLELNFDARRISRFVTLNEAMAWRLFKAEGLAPGTELRARQPESQSCLVDQREHPLPYSALLVLHDSERQARREGLVLICNGVRFHRPSDILGFPLAGGVVAAPLLKKNISHTDLVEDEAFNELIEELRLRVKELVQDRAESGHRVSQALRPELHKILVEHYPQPERPESIDRWLKQLEFDAGADNDECRELLEEADHAESAGLLDAAASLRADVRSALRRRMAEACEKGHYEKAASLSKRIDQLSHQLKESCDDLSACLAALAGQEPGSPKFAGKTPWEKERAILRLLALGDQAGAEELLEEVGGGGWLLYLRAELEANLEHYSVALRQIRNSGYLYHEAAAAHRLAGEYKESFKLRVQGYRNGTSTRHLFIRRMAEESRGKVGFVEQVHWTVRSHFAPEVSSQVQELKEELERPGDLEDLLDGIEKQFPARSAQSEYLTHLAVWELRRRRRTLRALRYRARWLLRRMLVVDKNRVRLISGDRTLG